MTVKVMLKGFPRKRELIHFLEKVIKDRKVHPVGLNGSLKFLLDKIQELVHDPLF
jgi:NifB/MoaA-like Fe-S oxidoreductase